MFFKGENSKYGLKDKNGYILIEPIYDEVTEFSDKGFAKARVGLKWETIYVRGNLYIEGSTNDSINQRTVFEEAVKHLEEGDIKMAMGTFKKSNSNEAILFLYEIFKNMGNIDMKNFYENELRKRAFSQELDKKYKEKIASFFEE